MPRASYQAMIGWLVMGAAGGLIGSGDALSARTIVGLPLAGTASNNSYTLLGGLIGESRSSPPPPSAITTMVRGTVDDPSAVVDVNGVAAVVTSGKFRVTVPLQRGPNTLTATATDVAGNRATAAIQVMVPYATDPPARPTVGTIGEPIPSVTTRSELSVSGTKTTGTSIWINGHEQVALNDHTQWTTTIPLVEGDNELFILAKDLAGTPSAEVVLQVILDTLPPVITFDPPAKTNLTPVTLHGSVDDHRTIVTINGVLASRSGREFEVMLPLQLGSNTLELEAISPNTHRTTEWYEIALGTVPTMDQAMPPDGTILYATQPATVTMTATDQETDPIAYQVAVDGTPVIAWSPLAEHLWTPTVEQIGLHTLSFQARDEYGGATSLDREVLIVHPPSFPP